MKRTILIILLVFKISLSLKSQSLPVVDFGFSDQCNGEIVEFTNLSYALSGEIMVFIWDFGDGKTSNAINPMHIYENSGSYNVKLTVIDDQGRFASNQKIIQIFTSPEFSPPESVSVCAEDILTIDPMIIFADSVSWTVNSTLISDSSILYHTANDSLRVFDLHLKASNANCSISEKIKIEINEKPDPHLLISGFCENSETAIQVDIDEPYNYYYEISLNDSLISSDRFFNGFLKHGTHLLKYSAIDKITGCRNMKSDTLEIFQIPEVLVDLQKTCKGDTSVFKVSNFNAENNYRWTSNFSDAEGEYYKELFKYPGWYEVKIKVEDSRGCKNEQILNHEVFYQPEAKFLAYDLCMSDTVEIINESEIAFGDLDYYWLFDSTNFSMEKQPNVWFSEPGNHRIDLRVTSENHCVDTFSKTIQVDELPTPGVIIADSNICSGSTSILTLEGHHGKIEFWEKSSHKTGIWSRINHSESELEINDSKSTDYRVWVSNGNCSAVPTPILSIFPNQTAFAGQIEGDLIICSNDDSLKYELLGFAGNNIEWQVFGDSLEKWSSIGLNHQSLNINNPGHSFKIRAIVSNQGCAPDTTQVVFVKFRNSPTKGIINAPGTICENADSIHIMLSDYVGEITYWQRKSEASVSWETLEKSSNLFTVKPLEKTHYRAEISGQECGTIFSDSISVDIKESGVAGEIIFSDSSFCMGDTVVAELQDFMGNIKWQLSSDNANWSDLMSNSSSLLLDTLSSSKYIRTIAEKNSCPADTSKVYFLKANPRPVVDFDLVGDCENEPILIMVDNPNESEISWSLNDSIISINDKSIRVEGGFHDLKMEAKESACSTEIVRSFYVHDVPEKALKNIEKCVGSEVRFSNDNGKSTWYWDSIFNSDENAIRLILEDTGVHILGLKIEYETGCIDSVHAEIKSLPIPELSLLVNDICIGEILDIAVSPENKDTDQWSLDNEKVNEDVLRDTVFDHSISHSVKIVRKNSVGCSNEISTQFHVNELPDASFVVPVNCLYDTLDLIQVDANDNSSSTWLLNESVILNPYIMKFEGSYVLERIVENEFGCINSHSERFEINALPSADFDIENICQYDSIFINPIANDDIEYFEWFWNDTLVSSNRELKYKANIAGNISLKLRVIDFRNCNSELEKIVNVNPTPKAHFEVNDICLDDEATFELIIDSLDSQRLSYQWMFGDGQYSIVKNPTIRYQEAGLYSVKLTVENEFDCRSTSEDDIQVNFPPNAGFEVFNTCLGDQTILKNTSLSSNLISTSNWQIGADFRSSKYNLDTVFKEAGQYEVLLKVVDENGCEDLFKSEVEINQNPDLIVSDTIFKISKGESVLLKVEGAENYIWQPSLNVSDPFGAYVEISPTTSTQYLVKGFNSNGCSSMQTIYISVEEDFRLLPQNILTPNQDGINDLWRIENVENYDNVKVEVYDGSGRRVYQSNDYQNNWDGSFGRDFLPDGTYYFLVSSEDFLNVYRGALTLIRGQ